MIVADIKPFKEIMRLVKNYRKICVIGCGTCVTVCHAGGQKQVSEVAAQLRLAAKLEKKHLEVGEETILRQCEHEFIDSLEGLVQKYDAIVSLGCGIGVQMLAERFPHTRILPGLNTKFMGAPTEPGIFWERCVGCGNCILAETGGFCPVTRCAKGLLNGPCGGSQNGLCEVSPDTPCVWQLIYEQLEAQGMLDTMEAITPPKDWSVGQGGCGPRRLVLEHLVEEEKDKHKIAEKVLTRNDCKK
ncbi:MAG TPA: methylenetetrahydrofolate reductase C-terminal domain-containing protein [Candidatus Brocadiia bacterium]|nr:methylenetetrahydrofolate reductase C-terminal domain-containing protein [Planctomycetota bacterium]MDO8093377.1 methylenetetrahydrofolate reductase C-terminal domain-containing protein [Candidatus Brocadiales bacterium]